MDCSCAPVSVFLCGVRWRHNRAPNLEPRFLVNFVPVWGTIASSVMNRFGSCFRNLLQDKMFFATHQTFRRYVCRWRHKIRKIAVEILTSLNNRTQCLRESAYYAWLLLTYIVINTILGRLTLDPAGMHCPSWDDAFVSSYYLSFVS